MERRADVKLRSPTGPSSNPSSLPYYSASLGSDLTSLSLSFDTSEVVVTRTDSHGAVGRGQWDNPSKRYRPGGTGHRSATSVLPGTQQSEVQ